MEDLTKRLRAEDTTADDCFAAADAIERLTQERDEARAEAERLRATVKVLDNVIREHRGHPPLPDR